MAEFDFTLRFDVSSLDPRPDEWVEQLAAAGCDDAVIGTGVPGRIALDFKRDALTAEDAVLSAVRDVKAALPEARLIEASPDLVGYTEVAEIVGRSRQNIRKLLLARRPGGPAPVHEGASTLWHLAPVLVWLRDEKDYSIDTETIELAQTNMRVNVAATQVNYGSSINDEILQVLEEKRPYG